MARDYVEGVFAIGSGNPLSPPARWTFCAGHTRYWTHVFDHLPLDSDEWIEYIPASGMFERNGECWWRYYSAHDDSMHYIQLTKGATP